MIPLGFRGGIGVDLLACIDDWGTYVRIDKMEGIQQQPDKSFLVRGRRDKYCTGDPKRGCP